MITAVVDSIYFFFERIFRFVWSMFGSKRVVAKATGGGIANFNPDKDFHPSLKDVPRYPPFDRGLPFISVDDLLKSQQNLVDRIHHTGLPYADEAVRNLAHYVHLLPATSNDFFCGAGGLFRLCLEIGFHSFVASQGNIFTSRDPAEKRRELDAKWQLAAFLSGLCCELSRTIVTSVVTNDKGEQWLPFDPITSWLSTTNSDRYFLRPPQASLIATHDTAHLSGVIVNAIIPAAALQHITTDDRGILMSMLSTITRITDTYNSGHFPKTVRHVRDQVIQRDKISNPLTFGKPLVGVHVEPYLVNGMRHLVKNGTWKANQKLARIHVAPDGTFIFWSTGVKEILDMLREEGAVGIPSDPRTLGELLMNSGVLEPNPEGGLWWYIKTPVSPTVYEVVKLSNPSIVLDDDTIAATSVYPGPVAIDHATAKALRNQAEQETPTTESAQSEVEQQEPASTSEVNANALTALLAVPAQSSGAPLVQSKPNVRDYSKALALTASPPLSAENVTPAANQRPAKKPRPPKTGPDHASAAPGHVESPRVEPKPASPKPAAPPVSAQQNQKHSDPVASVLKRPSLITDMHRLVDLHNSSEDSSMFWVEQGLAIPLGTLNSNVDAIAMSVVLAEASCLFIAKGQTIKYHDLPHGGKNVRCIVIHAKNALEFGFHKQSEGEPAAMAMSEE